MKIALFSDIHANLIALETFVKATHNAVDAYVCLGDTVNYGPWNDECLEIVHQLPNIITLEGNHERLFLGTESIEHELLLVRDFYDCSSALFSRKDLITSLPKSIELEDFICIHTINACTVYPDTSIQVCNHYIIGHTHHQFEILRSGFKIVNPGSIGQNRKWIDMVDYAILDTKGMAIHMYSARYNLDMFLDELHARNYSQNCIDYYASKPKMG